ncbi:hypothetical protein U91I_00546 [alpha proteobacterium U9-1i]|nr:hypothetical protein U91I_00546 [alpha proteobacterium U9-1i]
MVMQSRKSCVALVAACFLVASCGPALTDNPEAETIENLGPQASETNSAMQVGDCVETSITLVGSRLEGVADSGSGVEFANGMSQVSYDVLPGVSNSRVGDPVRLCLVSVPQNCPPGDDRGRVYAGTNLRTNETWTAPDSQHMCGGA